MSEDKTIDLQHLRSLALSATPGPWHFDCGNGEVESQHDYHFRICIARREGLSERIRHCEEFGLEYDPPRFPVHPDGDMEFIAACDPETILNLIKRVEMAEAQARATCEFF